ncbi:MAG: flavin reductase family protein [Candidatus Caenarcaniphilales bacterium]|nr:flavin reductase family protein [Candidatus Caenarcaniphilales bacterium]
MKSFTVSDLEHKDVYSLMISLIAPRPIAFVSTVSKSGIDNLAPFSYFNGIGSNPASISFSIATRADGSLKDTAKNLLESRSCVINFVTEDIFKAMKITAKEFEHSIDEFTEAKLTKLPSDLIKSVRVKESIAQFECELIDLVNVSDRLESLIEHSIFGFNTELKPGSGNLAVCKILKVHFDESLLREGTENKIDVKQYKPVARLGAKFYSKVTDSSVFT